MRTLNQTYVGGKVNVEAAVKTLPDDLVEEISRAVQSVGGYGSIEIYVQDYSVTQITVRNIKKTKHILAE